MKPSQIPDCSRGYRPLAFLSQLLKSPITLTASALGAQTAKYVPSGSCERCAPILSKRWPCVPSLKRCRSKGLSRERAIIAVTPAPPGQGFPAAGCSPSPASVQLISQLVQRLLQKHGG